MHYFPFSWYKQLFPLSVTMINWDLVKSTINYVICDKMWTTAIDVFDLGFRHNYCLVHDPWGSTLLIVLYCGCLTLLQHDWSIANLVLQWILWYTWPAVFYNILHSLVVSLCKDGHNFFYAHVTWFLICGSVSWLGSMFQLHERLLGGCIGCTSMGSFCL